MNDMFLLEFLVWPYNNVLVQEAKQINNFSIYYKHFKTYFILVEHNFKTL